MDRVHDLKRGASALLAAMALGVSTPVLAQPAATASPAPTAAKASEAAPALRAAILPLDVEGELSDADRGRLSEQLVQGLQRGAFAVTPPEQTVSAVPEAGACRDPKCHRQTADKTAASHVVRARVSVRDRDYKVYVELIDGSDGSVLASSQEACEICGIVDAGELMSTVAATLRTKLDALARGPALLTLGSSPPGAIVTIDGNVVGTTPVERPTIPGKHVVRISKEGFIAIEREVTVVEGTHERLDFELERVPSRLPGRGWGWASLFVGIAALGTGIGFTVIDDRQYEVGNSCDGANRRGDECKYLWDTEWIGIGTSIAGAALITLGVAVLINTAERRPKRAKAGKAAKAGTTARTRTGSRIRPAGAGIRF